MKSKEFTTSYTKVIEYLSERDPMFAEYLVARMPKSVKIDSKVLLRIKKNKKNWLGRKSQVSQSPDFVLPYTTFTDSVYYFADLYTNGSSAMKIAPNKYRANKFKRILKILGDDRYKSLKK